MRVMIWHGICEVLAEPLTGLCAEQSERRECLPPRYAANPVEDTTVNLMRVLVFLISYQVSCSLPGVEWPPLVVVLSSHQFLRLLSTEDSVCDMTEPSH